MYDGWARQDPHAILDMHASIPESIRKDVLEQAMYQIVREDPDSVLSLAADLLNINDAMQPSGAVMMALQSLAENDLQLAMNWIEDNVKGAAKTTYVASTLMHTARSDPEKAFNFALTMPETNPSPEFNVLMSMLFSDGAESAKKFVPRVRGELWRNYGALGTRRSARQFGLSRSLGVWSISRRRCSAAVLPECIFTMGRIGSRRGCVKDLEGSQWGCARSGTEFTRYVVGMPWSAAKGGSADSTIGSVTVRSVPKRQPF